MKKNTNHTNSDIINLRDLALKNAYETERKRLRLKTASELYRMSLKKGLAIIKKMKEEEFN